MTGPFHARTSARRGPLRFAIAATLLAALSFSSPDRAEEVSVPVTLQAELLVKVAAYDRNMAARAGARVGVVIVTKAGDGESARVARTMKAALGTQQLIAGIAHDETIEVFTDAASLAKACAAKRTAIVYFAPGFSDDEIAAVAKALDGGNVLTGAAVPSFVPKGIVLGFDLVSGKPKLLVHLAQARRQNVALSAEVLKLMRVYE